MKALPLGGHSLWHDLHLIALELELLSDKPPTRLTWQPDSPTRHPASCINHVACSAGAHLEDE